MVAFHSVPLVSKRPKADLMIVPFFKGGQSPVQSVKIADLKKEIDLVLKGKDFSGEEGSQALVYLSGKKEQRLLLLGLGDEKTCSMESLRRAFAAGFKCCQNKKWSDISVVLPKVKKLEEADIQRAICEGIGLTSYVFDEWKSKENKKPFFVKKVALLGAKKAEAGKKVSNLLTGVNLARDLMNGNALEITPQRLGKEAKKLAAAYPAVKATVFDKKWLEKEKMGLLLAVANGSECDPVLIQLEYKGDPKSKDLTLIVGKGVTFDTGGLNLKPTGYIEDMRADMGGAAAALGIVKAAAAMKLKKNFAVIIPSTENAIGSKSFKPGDTYTSYLGKSVEIGNTDAEGRLILADALAYGQKKFSPNRIIDMATLTGAILIALGIERSGLFCNNDKLAKLCEKAGEKSGELVWRMPLDSEYKPLFKSDIADIKNCGGRQGGSITAALFLKEFVLSDTPWIHLDIAGTAFLDRPRRYHSTQATGAGVRLVIELLESL